MKIKWDNEPESAWHYCYKTDILEYRRYAYKNVISKVSFNNYEDKTNPCNNKYNSNNYKLESTDMFLQIPT